MVKWCEICEVKEVLCALPGVHQRRDKHGLAARQEIRFGMHEEECRVDAEKGREESTFKWKGEPMESGEAREMYRAQGRAAAELVAGAREERIGRQACEICMVERRECDRPEVHFSKKMANVAHCNEVSVFECVGCWSVLGVGVC